MSIEDAAAIYPGATCVRTNLAAIACRERVPAVVSHSGHLMRLSSRQPVFFRGIVRADES